MTPASDGMVNVRAIRPHDTSEGMRQPGDTYVRDAGSATQLEAKGVVEIIRAKKATK